jgi:Uma2 family endonuclease
MRASRYRAAPISLEQYERLRDVPGYRSELARGWLVRELQPGAVHGEVTGRLFVALDAFVRSNELGKVINQTGFLLSIPPPTARGPDVAFVRRERVPAEPPAGFWPGAPDLAVEVASPANSIADLQEKGSSGDERTCSCTSTCTLLTMYVRATPFPTFTASPYITRSGLGP